MEAQNFGRLRRRRTADLEPVPKMLCSKPALLPFAASTGSGKVCRPRRGQGRCSSGRRQWLLSVSVNKTERVEVLPPRGHLLTRIVAV